ncbi:hypothetical protein Y032_0304g1937 [Ancylostoma ceylanicum]|uniref:Uncharacterized protein n=1 Tax=Ancylostoma ceylanicum TaxID=53326 RepID=A0A016S3D5_9BILA|nr:hypothetical protein Y032_0304g1937 [Ancylostoma ceylanicum]
MANPADRNETHLEPKASLRLPTATLIAAFGYPSSPSIQTLTAPSTNRLCIAGLTPLESKQSSVRGGPSAPIRVAWPRPFFPS